MAVASTGPATTGNRAASAVSWQSRSFWDPPTNYIYRLNSPAGQAPGLLYGVPVLECQALEHAPRHGGGFFWWVLPRLLAEAPDTRWHVTGGEERRMVGVDQWAGGRSVFGEVGQFLVGVIVAFPGPLLAALLEYPEPHHVLQQTCPPPETSLVGEVSLHGFLCYHRLRYLDTNERPGSAGDVREVLTFGGHRYHGRGRVVGSDREDGRPRADLFGNLGETWTAFGGRRDDGPEDARREIHPLEEVPSPSTLLEIEELRSCGVGILAGLLAGEPVVHQVGDQEHSLGGLEEGRSPHGEELVEGVYREELDACDLVDLLLRHEPEGLLHHALCARVTVVVGVRDERPFPIQKPEVHAPGIYSYALDLLLPHGFRQPVLDLREEPQNVPVQPIGQADGRVREAMDLFERDAPAVEAPEHDAPALGPEVYREIPGAHPRAILPSNS